MMRSPGVGVLAEELQLQVDAQKLLFELSDAAVIVHVPSLTIRAANPGSEVTLGYPQAELVGSALDVILSPSHGSGVVDRAEALLHSPGLHEEVALRRQDGTTFTGTVHVLQTEYRGEQMAILFVRDITERRKLERELITKHIALKEAYEELEHANSELAHANAEIRTAQRCLVHLEKMATVGRFAAGVAHEVNNPMAFIMENLSRLHELSAFILPALRSHLDGSVPLAVSREKLDEVVCELQAIIDESLEGAQRVSSIVRQLHSFSNITEQEAEWIDLRDVIESAIMMVKNQMRHRARLERYFYEIPKVACVPGQIVQVVVNLLVNAIHAIEEGRAEQNIILVRTRSVGEMVALEVSDTGVGIPPENLPRIMDPFFTTKPPGQGTGLGLAISSSIVEQHGGRIEVESQPGRGTTLRVLLPVASRHHRVVQGHLEGRSGGQGRRLKIFFVDDETFLLRALKRSLGKTHDLRLASTSKEVLDLLEADPTADLVVVDLMMPEMDGVQLYHLLAERFPHLKDRVVFMSGGVFTEPIKSFLARSGMQVLPKPFTHADLDHVLAAMGAQG